MAATETISGPNATIDNLKTLFALQDQITMEVMATVNVKFSAGFQRQIRSLKYSRPSNLKAYEYYLKGIYHFPANPTRLLTARQMFEEAINLDPNFAAAYRRLGFAYADEVWFRMTKSPEKSIEQAEQAAQKCVALAPDQPPPYGLLSAISLLKKDFDNAILYGEKAVDLSPNDAGCYFSLGLALRMQAVMKKQLRTLKLLSALRLSGR